MNKTKPVFFLASLFAASSLFAETAWVTGAYDTRDWDPCDNNILRLDTTTLLGTSAVVRGFGDTNDPALLTDGAGADGAFDSTKIMCASSGHVEWSFGKPMYLYELRIYSRWGDGGRDGIAIDDVKVKYSSDGEWTSLGCGAVSYGLNDNNTAGSLFAVLKDSDDAPIASLVVGLQIVFSNAQDNSGTGYAEIEAIGSDQQLFPQAKNVWQTGGAWPVNDDFIPGVNNVISGLTPSEDSIGADGSAGAGEGVGLPEKLTDGEAKTGSKGYRCAVSTDNVFAYNLEEPADIRECRFYSVWDDNGRDTINIRAIKVKLQGATRWRTLSNSAVTVVDDSSHRNYAFFKKEDGSPLATNVVAIQFCFGYQENNWVGYAEFEALAVGPEPTGRMDIETRGYDHVVLNGVVTGLGKGATTADVFFAYQEGDTTDGLSLEGAASRGTVTQADQAAVIALDGLEQQTTYSYIFKIVNDRNIASEVYKGTFTTAQLVPVVDGKWLTVPAGDWAEVTENRAIEGFDNMGTLVVKTGGRLTDSDGFGNASTLGLGEGITASLTLEENAYVEVHAGSQPCFHVGGSGGRGYLTVGAGATFTTGLNRMVLANGSGTYANLAIYGTVSASEVHPNANWPGTTLSVDPLGRTIASETTVYAGGKLSCGVYKAWDFARCNLTLAGGTLEVTRGGADFFNNESAKATLVLAVEPAATPSVIDVGANDVTFTRPGKDGLDPAPTGSRTLYLMGTGALEKRGSGTLALTERIDMTRYEGDVSVSAGALRLDGAAATFNSLSVAPGAFLYMAPGASLAVKTASSLGALRLDADYDYDPEVDPETGTAPAVKAAPVLDGFTLADAGTLDLVSARDRSEVLTGDRIPVNLTFANATIGSGQKWSVTFNGTRTPYHFIADYKGSPVLKLNQGLSVIVR